MMTMTYSLAAKEMQSLTEHQKLSKICDFMKRENTSYQELSRVCGFMKREDTSYQKLSKICDFMKRENTSYQELSRVCGFMKREDTSTKLHCLNLNGFGSGSPPPLKVNLLALYGSSGSSALSIRKASGDKEEKPSYLKIACVALAVLAFAGLGALAYRRYYAPA